MILFLLSRYSISWGSESHPIYGSMVARCDSGGDLPGAPHQEGTIGSSMGDGSLYYL